MKAIVEDAQSIKPEVSIIAGDLFNRSRVWADTALDDVNDALEKFVIPLCGCSDEVVLLFGTMNHDNPRAFELIKKATENLSNLHIYTTPAVEKLDTKEGPVQIMAVPGFDKARLRLFYEQIAAEVSSMLKQPPGIIVSKIMAMVLQAPTIGSSEAKEDVPDDRFDALAAPWARKIRAAFPAAFVNMHNELILIPKANTYIMLNQVRDERDFKAAVLEDCSRNAFKGCSRKLQDEHLDGINKLLDTKFTRDDMELIYTYLGNGIQHDLCLRFVASGYDLEVLREYDKKQEAGSNGKA